MQERTAYHSLLAASAPLVLVLMKEVHCIGVACHPQQTGEEGPEVYPS